MANEPVPGTCWRHVGGFSMGIDRVRWNGTEIEYVGRDGVIDRGEKWTLEDAADLESEGRWVRVPDENAKAQPPKDEPMEDYKYIDEVLLEYMRLTRLQPIDLWATNDSLMFGAIRRVYKAYTDGKPVTLTWARFFDSLRDPAAKEQSRPTAPDSSGPESMPFERLKLEIFNDPKVTGGVPMIDMTLEHHQHRNDAAPISVLSRMDLVYAERMANLILELVKRAKEPD